MRTTARRKKNRSKIRPDAEHTYPAGDSLAAAVTIPPSPLMRGVGHRFGEYAISRMDRRVPPTVPAVPAVPTVQRVIMKDKLNVAGEYHKKTAGERNVEQQMAAIQSDGLYWQEGDFPLTEAQDAQKADPFALRVMQMLRERMDRFDNVKPVVDEYQNIVQQSATIKPSDMDYDWVKEREVERTKEMAESTQLIMKSDITIEQIRAMIEGYTAEEPGRIPAVAGLTTYFAEATAAAAAFRQLTWTVPVAKIELFMDYKGALEGLYAAFKDISGVGDASSADIRSDRSHAMHDAANARHTTAGIWMIGENHVKDINDTITKKPNASKIEYNLIPKDEFAQDVKTFQQMQGP